LTKNILVTGGLGFIGSRIVECLLKKKYNVIIIDNFFSNVKKKSKCKILKADITNFRSLEKIRLKSIYAIYHLAGQSSGPKSASDPELDARLNIIGTINMLNFASKNKVKKFIFSSTFTVYGDPAIASQKISETDRCKPKSMYGISKKCCEEYVKSLSEKNNIKWTILRLFNVYGPGQNIERLDQGIVGIFINLIKKKDTIEITGSLDRFKDLIYIDDVVKAFILSLNKKGDNQIFNVGTGRKTKISNLIKNINNIFEPNNKKKIKVLSAPHGEIKGAYADIKKINQKLNFSAKTNLREGLIKFKNYLNL
tara:strand:+ start:6363 stop:7292 length:930 start_codon:yes stop_codon:yes gene_type:complete